MKLVWQFIRNVFCDLWNISWLPLVVLTSLSPDRILSVGVKDQTHLFFQKRGSLILFDLSEVFSSSSGENDVEKRCLFFFPCRFISFYYNYRVGASRLSVRQWMVQPQAAAMWLASTGPGWGGWVSHLLKLWAASSRGERGWFNKRHHLYRRLVWIGIWWENRMRPVCSYFNQHSISFYFLGP